MSATLLGHVPEVEGPALPFGRQIYPLPLFFHKVIFKNETANLEALRGWYGSQNVTIFLKSMMSFFVSSWVPENRDPSQRNSVNFSLIDFFVCACDPLPSFDTMFNRLSPTGFSAL